MRRGPTRVIGNDFIICSTVLLWWLCKNVNKFEELESWKKYFKSYGIMEEIQNSECVDVSCHLCEECVLLFMHVRRDSFLLFRYYMCVICLTGKNPSSSP